ncbi:UDP-3-O-acylglucosamine N-acyltransferase [compost metagenome]
MGRGIKRPVSANDIAAFLGLPAAKVAEGAVALVAPEHAGGIRGHALISASPRLDFARALDFIEQAAGYAWSEAEPEIHPTASIGKNVVLGKGVVIGENARILHNVVIGDEVTIGARSVVKSCAVIGEDGFGFERDEAGRAVRLPHLGRVVMEEDVEIGSLTTVCRGTLGDTVVRRGAKIDDHVHIAHNVDVGEDAFVIACAEVSGGVKLGKQSWIAPNASVLNQLNVGEKAVVGLGAVVVRDVDERSIVAGNPAKFIRLVP